MVLLVFAIVYFLPTIIALANDRKKSKAPTILVNVLLGWTGIAWVISLIMACLSD